MKKFKVIQSTVASLMAVSMIGLSACDLLFGDNPAGDGQTYNVTLNENGGTLVSDLTSYVSGVETVLPDAEKEHYIFDGWYADENFSDSAIQTISENSTGDVEYWAKWTPETYSVTYYIDNVEYTESDVTNYTYNVETDLPAPAKDNYSFTGWYENSGCTGNSVMEIAQGEYGNKIYYATWTPDTYKITFNADGGTIKNPITGYTYGVETALPTPTKAGYAFDGWYDNADFNDAKYEVITVGETGNKTFYAKWTKTNIIDCEGYEEGAYVSFYPNGNSLSSISVSYKSLDGSHAYQAIDKELIREYDGYVRADIVGLAEGAYSLEINVGGTKEYKDVSVTSYDRSGYAFYNRSAYATDTTASVGVGAYKDDGTPKDNAQIIYFNEENKNTQVVNFTGTSYSFTGIANVLTNLYRAKNPVIIRIVGKISAATWKLLDYNADKKYSASNKMPVSNVIGINGNPLPTTSTSTSLTQANLITEGYNELDTSVYSELLGLSSKATYSSGAFDSAWNDCSITSGAHDVTVEGIGTDAEIFQWGMTWKQASSIEVRNLTFTDYTEDACAFQGDTNVKNGAIEKFESYYIWLHNCTFNRGKNYWDLTDEQDKHDGDGSSDLKLVYGVTISYNHYVTTHKTGLVGASDTSFSYNITFHHNYYEGCESRMPLARLANMHMYNNYYKDSSGTNMSLRTSAWAFIEGCYFENAKKPVTVGDTTAVAKILNCEFTQGSNGSESALKLVTDQIVQTSGSISNSNNANPYKNFDTNSSCFYVGGYTVTSATQAKEDCIAYSGVHKKKL